MGGKQIYVWKRKGASINYVRRLGGGGEPNLAQSHVGERRGLGKYVSRIFFRKKQCKIARKLG